MEHVVGCYTGSGASTITHVQRIQVAICLWPQDKFSNPCGSASTCMEHRRLCCQRWGRPLRLVKVLPTDGIPKARGTLANVFDIPAAQRSLSPATLLPEPVMFLVAADVLSKTKQYKA